MLKRTFDCIVAATALILLSPVLVVVAVLVATRLGVPVLFRQYRVGLHERQFRILKFRTMKEAVGLDGEPLPDEQRVTPVGRFLRATSLDELPSLLNVLRGDMSLVGPRPLLPEYLSLYNSRQARRHEVRPGITGLTQVRGRNGLGWQDKFEHDVWYVQNRTFWLDLKILAVTPFRVLMAQGINEEGRVGQGKFTGNE